MEQSTIKQNLSSILKAVTTNEELVINFQENIENNFFSFDKDSVSENIINLPNPDRALTNIGIKDSEDELEIFDNRALIDLSCAYKLFHNYDLKDFSDKKVQSFINDFEKIRVSYLIKAEFLGCWLNILKKIQCDVILLGDEINSKILSLILLRNLIGKKTSLCINDKTDEIINKIGRREPKIVDLIDNLKNYLADQTDFSIKVIEIEKLWQDTIEKEQKEQNERDKRQKNDDLPDNSQENAKNIAQNNDNNEESTENINEDEVEDDKTIENTTKDQGDIQKYSEKDNKIQNFSSNSNEFQEGNIEFKNPYKVFSAKYDEIINPQKITKKEDLAMLRLELDLKIENLGPISKKLTTKLKQKLLSKKYRNPNPNDLEGILNRKKLTSIISSPSPRNIFLERIENNLNDTAVTILLDNSGSMRGRPIIMAALACEILSKIFENFQIRTEIIGFTTADWKGGKVKRDWEISGKPKNPGRLNELRHIIYKSFNQSFKKSKVNLGLMLKEGVLKENIDGEALLFAKSRLLNREEKRKILMVISDGNPIDDSTNLVNDEDILSDHLRQVVNNIQKEKKIEVLAIGVGHDTDGFYRNSITIRNLNELGDAMIEKISRLL